MSADQLDDALELNGQEELDPNEQSKADPEANDVEERARAMGWRPKDEYKGHPDHWKPAEEYVAVGESKLPVLKENFNRTLEENRAMKQKLSKIEKDFTNFQKSHLEALKTQRETLLANLKEKQRIAVEDGDVDKWEKLEQQKEKVAQDYSPKESKQEENPQEMDRDSILALRKFESDNPWFKKDPYLNAQAGFIFDDLHKKGIPMQDALTEVERRIRNDFSDYASRYDGTSPAKKTTLPKVQGTRQVGGKQEAAKTFNDLPDDAKVTCNSMVRKGILTQEQYVKDYFGE